MTRLSNLKPRIPTLRHSVAWLPEGSAEVDRARRDLPWRKWYSSTRWGRLRWSVLLRDQFTCQLCGRLEGKTSLLVADHKTPHHGNPRLFWDVGNIWTLCKPCHDGAKREEERASSRPVIGSR